MWFSLIICTYNRSKSILRLLESLEDQSLYPNELLIIDASEEDGTKELFLKNDYKNLRYFKVPDNQKGLTRQRNYGIEKVAEESEIICFLDDDIILEQDYFKNLILTYHSFPKALAVGGYIIENITWSKISDEKVNFSQFDFDGYKRQLGGRYKLRKKFNLLPDKPPGFMPEYSHGFPIAFLPPSNQIYPVEYFMGGVSSYKKSVFNQICFSERFRGYGLYEDMDFCLRISKLGPLYVNTSAKVQHLHEESGRPDYFKYGKMMIKNGHYVWRLKFPDPEIKNRIKWHLINYILIFVRLTNVLNDPVKTRPLMDATGRIYGLLKLCLGKSK